MKKIFFSILLFASFSYSHSQILSTELSKDEIFVSYVNHFDQLIDHLSSHFTKPALQLLKNDIENSRANNLSQSEEVSLISGLIKFDDPTQLGLLISSIRKSHYELTKKYGEINKNIFISAYNDLINQVETSPNNAFAGCRRPWRFGLCAAASGVEGAGILAACEAASGGVATPFCIAGAATWVANEVADCRERYCDPLTPQ